MTFAILCLASIGVIATALHLFSVAIASRRCRTPGTRLQAPLDGPPVTLIIPVCGIENYIENTLRSALSLDYPRYEVIFCIARSDDAAVPLVRQLIAEHAWIDARLVIGDERISANPKLNNIYKGWRAASHDLIGFIDSNVLLPPDCIQRLLANLTVDTGIVCSPPLACLPYGFWAELECAFLNAYQLRWQYTADAAGFGFAQGKIMFWHRSVVEHAGGIHALGAEAAEDAAATKAVRSMGRSVRLMEPPVRQPLGKRHLQSVWARQRRWASLRRASFPGFFALEIFSGGLLPALSLAAVLSQAGVPFGNALVAIASLWYGAELWLAWRAGWHLSRYSLACAVLRDLLIPVLYLCGWFGGSFHWRGNRMRAVTSSKLSSR